MAVMRLAAVLAGIVLLVALVSVSFHNRTTELLRQKPETHGVQVGGKGFFGKLVKEASHSGARKGKIQSLAGLMTQSDFPYAIGAGVPASDDGEQQLAAFTPATKTSSLADDNLPAEIKATDSPIGIAEAAKILQDSEGLDKSKESGALDKWKDAVKGSGPKMMEDMADDVTAFNPFPKQSMSEKMEIEDVWKKAQAMAKPAGKLDGTADENKKTIDNAAAQADSMAYLAANEAAAVDSYDVSMPNPDMMAKGKVGLKGQAFAAPTHQALAMRGQAKAQSGHVKIFNHQAVFSPRVQALAQVDESLRMKAKQEAKEEHRRIDVLRKKLYEAEGAEKEAEALASDDDDMFSQMGVVASRKHSVTQTKHAIHRQALRQSVPSSVESWQKSYEFSKHQEAALERELKAAKLRAAQAHAGMAEAEGSAGHRSQPSLKAQASELERELAREENVLKASGTRMSLAGTGRNETAADASQNATVEPKEAKAEEGEEHEEEEHVHKPFFVNAHRADDRVTNNHNGISDAVSWSLGDTRVPIEDIENDVHGATQQPMNMATHSHGLTYLNGLNSGWDPLDFDRSYIHIAKDTD